MVGSAAARAPRPRQQALHGRAGSPRGRCSPSPRPRSRCAARTSPPTTAPSTSRSGATSTASRARGSTSAAARTYSGRSSLTLCGRKRARRRGRPRRCGPLARLGGRRRRARGLGGALLLDGANEKQPVRPRARLPGHELQHRFLTAEPTPEQLEVAEAGPGGVPPPRIALQMATTEQQRKRLPPEIFDLPVEKMREGYYTDAYFNHARDTLLADGRHPRVVMQVFQKKRGRARRDGRGDRRPQALRRRLGRADRPRALRRRRDRARGRR